MSGCLMLQVPDTMKDRTIAWTQHHVKDSILMDDGIEYEPHITLAYGFTDKVLVDDLRSFLMGWPPVKFELGPITTFSNEDRDVLKVDIISKQLHLMNDTLRKYFGKELEVTFPVYHPHMTLAYVQKGSVDHLIGKGSFVDESEYISDHYIYSFDSEPTGIRHKWNLDMSSMSSFSEYIGDTVAAG